MGTGTATLSSFDPGGQPRDFRLNFRNSLPAAGTFTALTVIPTATFNNPVNYGNIVAGMIPAAAPNTNSPLQIQVIPEPQVGVLVLAGIVILGLRRRRS